MSETYNVSILPGSVEVSVLPTVGVEVNMETNTIVASIEPATIVASVALYGGTGLSTTGNIAVFTDMNGVLLSDSGLSASSFASASQGGIAETALQPSDVGSAAYTSSGDYEAAGAIATHALQSSGVHSLGTVASHAFEEFQPAGTYVTSVSGAAPVVSSGGVTPAISMAAATDLVDGYLTADDHTIYDAHVNAIDANPHGTDHDMLDDIQVLDPTSADATKDKHLSNAQGKKWEDHVDITNDNPHGTDLSQLDDVSLGTIVYGDFLGWDGTDWVNTRKIGDGTNYTEFEGDGTLKLNGSATGFDDMLFEIQYQDADARPVSGVLGAAGASATGTFQNLYRRNGILWTITEGGSAGRMMELTFQDVRQVPVLFFTGIYTGTVAHAANLTWQAYNYVTTVWDNLTFTWANATQYIDVSVPTGFTAQHVSGSGQVKIAVNHASVIIGGHTLALDEVYLVEDNQPASLVFRGGRVQSFRNTGFDMFHGKVQFRHAYKVASNFFWHVHFTNYEATITDGQTVVFTLSQSFAAINYVFPTETTLTATFTNNSTWRSSLTVDQAASILSGTTVVLGSHLIAAGASTISGTNLNISAIGLLEIIRSVGTHTGNIGILYSDFHIEQDTLASRTEFAK